MQRTAANFFAARDFDLQREHKPSRKGSDAARRAQIASEIQSVLIEPAVEVIPNQHPNAIAGARAGVAPHISGFVSASKP
jgi:hypothetical protein